jgi:lipopolysaccharide export system protein LptC
MTPRRHVKLFPLVLLALLGGLSFWLQSLTDWLSASVGHDKDAATPDYVLEGFSATVFERSGGIKQHLTGFQHLSGW